MASLTYAQLRTKLDTRLNDTSNQLIDSSFKDEFMNEAFNDPYVYVIDRDKTLVVILGQEEYTLPTQFDSVLEIGIDINSDGNTFLLDPSAYHVYNGTIVFTPFYSSSLPVGTTIIVIGRRHYTTTDSLPQPFQEYVMELALAAAWKWLSSKLADNFLTNDMTMADLLQKISYHERRASELRRSLPNRNIARF